MIDLFDLSLFSLILVFIAIIIAGFVHGSLGFGYPMTSVPLLALIIDLQTAIFITLIPTIVLNLVSIFSIGKIDKEVWKYWVLFLFIILGSIIGANLLIFLDADTFKLFLAGVIFFYLYTQKRKLVIFSWVNQKQKLGKVFFGFVSGFTSGTISVMVPVIIIYAFEVGLVGSAIMVQVMNIAFLLGKGMQFIVFALNDIITYKFLLQSIPITLASLVPLFIGMRVRDKIDEENYKNIVKKILFILAILMSIQYFI
ncbi:MAG TPA: sulfite exporter TauE/SafE family protein [Arcobacter sp.]|jgi:uncharacterized membrane protein YfcA|nr:sulfite exporter TauE/SafE family protein [Arcobacter sp.]